MTRHVKKRVASVALSTVFLLLVLTGRQVWINRVPDPIYHGKRLSEILDTKASTVVVLSGGSVLVNTAGNLPELKTAVKEIGPGAVPLLASWLREGPDTPFKARGRRVCARLGLPIPGIFQCRTREALAWLACIPEHAMSVAPLVIQELAGELDAKTPGESGAATLLSRMLEQANREDRKRLATSCLRLFPKLFELANDVRIRAEAVRLAVGVFANASLSEMQHRQFVDRITAEAQNANSPWLGDRVADPLDPDYTLRNELLLSSALPGQQSSGADFFRTHPVKSERIIPLLLTRLSSTNRNVVEQSARALGAYGPLASNALPELERIREKNPGRFVAEAVSNAIARIEFGLSELGPTAASKLPQSKGDAARD